MILRAGMEDGVSSSFDVSKTVAAVITVRKVSAVVGF